jgi:hypothetical protein
MRLAMARSRSMNRAILFANDVPAWLRFPGGPCDSCLEQVGFWNTLSRQNELFLMLRQIAGEVIQAVRKQPDASILDVDMGEERCPREIDLRQTRQSPA